jgi:hypothetical protein
MFGCNICRSFTNTRILSKRKRGAYKRLLASWVVGNGSLKFNVSRALLPDQQFKPTFFGQTWGEAHSSERGEEPSN